MKTTIIQIGNSQGVRIPKAILEQLGFKKELVMEVRGDRLVMYKPHKPRQGWTKAAAAMAENGDDRLLDETSHSTWDATEWEW